ncbi:tRNA-uridine aminocarboxypropyltransferase [Roseateles oligotrophus]|uniref:tRNA-uridine aminocarboxypropyltransferase n=1 Tax=Roseateles oligotrophus TaxID=1769250 RepID=A0ABT2YKZ9_9BURK|nr:tRNA-uridine aminocarboxypropyltransferase [Roseateles oligotrophus]MCV2370677.1 DTW domain-containing protein [Roseateles oligotrophus]
MTPPGSQRARCLNCQRPLSACICPWVRPAANRVELLLLQHPLEQDHAKGTARLLQLSLRRCRIWVGETFDPLELAQALATPEPDQSSWLLYPEDRPQAGECLITPPTCTRLVVLDATWRKSRKMLLLNPLLQQLPRLALRDPPASRYAIRKAHLGHQLSTLEASVLALQQLEGPSPAYEDLLVGFDGFVAQQARLFQAQRL